MSDDTLRLKPDDTGTVVGEATGRLTGETTFADWLATMLHGMAEHDADSVECKVKSWINGKAVTVIVEVRLP